MPVWCSMPSAVELAHHDLGGPMLLEAQLRMRVQVAAHGGQLGVLGTDMLDGAHETRCV